MATFGAALKRAREQRKVSLDEIAAETRLSKRYILALEDEAISKLPGGTYNRAYLRTYATVLGLDPESLLRDYALEESRQLQLAEADQLAAMSRAIETRAAAAAAGGTSATRVREVLATPAGIAAVAFVAFAIVGGAVWFGLSGFHHASSDLEVASVESVPEPGTPPATPPSAAPSPPLAAPAPVSGPAPVGSARGGENVPTPPPTTVTESAPPTVAAAPATGAAGAPAPSPESSASAARGDVVRVSDARGASRLSVAGSGVGTAVVERQLVGQADRFTVGSRVVFWTHVRGGRVGDTIDHVWFRDGTLVGAASLAVGSPDWRTQSRRLLDPGAWVVEARDAEGHVLARHEFEAAAP